MPRWLGLDHGSKRIGAAVGDSEQGVVSPVATLPAEPLEDALRRVAELAGEYHAHGIVVGWPLNMDGSEGPQGKAARHVAATLAEMCDMDVRMWDERLSSFEADRRLAGRLTRKKRRAKQDALAAAVILEDFLRQDGPRRAPRPGDKP
jgi:putative Holliday junction resolvase